MTSARSTLSEMYSLHPSGHALGLSCGPQGPTLGPIALLAKTAWGFVPRPVEELDAVLSCALGDAVTTAALTSRLSIIAQALNAGNIAKAVIATQQMRLRPLSAFQAERARTAEALSKIDPYHWPAGSPEGRGGQFAPKDQAGSNDAPKEAEPTGTGFDPLDAIQPADSPEVGTAERAIIRNLDRKIVRRAIRASLKFILKDGRIFRYLTELAADEVPIVDVVSGALTVKDSVQLVGEAYDLATETRAALDFVKHGPQELEALQVAAKPGAALPKTMDAFRKVGPTIDVVANYDGARPECGACISDSDALVKIYGEAPPGYEYHHIVEQAANDAGELLHSRENVVLLPKLLHEEVTAEFAKLDKEVGKTLRQQAKGRSFAERYAMGLKVMRDLGILK